MLGEAAALGAQFHIRGDRVEIDRLDVLPSVLADRLQARADLILEFVNGHGPDHAAQEFFNKLNAAVELVTTSDGLLAAFEVLGRDVDAHGGTVAIDFETAPLPEQASQRPPVHINKDGSLSAMQPAFKDRTALDPHRAYVAVLQLYAGGDTVFVVHDTDTIAAALNSRWLREHELVAHNATFEVVHLQQWATRHLELMFLDKASSTRSRGRIHCTAQATGLLIGTGYGGGGRSLDNAAAHFLKLTPPKALQTSDWSAPTLSRGQIAYAASDVVLVHRLWRTQQGELQRTGRWDAYELQRRAIPAVADMERRGLLLDRTEHERQVSGWTTELAEARRNYTTETCSPPPTTPNELRDWLRRILPPNLLAHWPRTANSHDLSTEGVHLKRLVHLPGTLPVLRMLQRAKLLSTFGAKLTQHINPVTGRIHPSFSIAAAKSGRFACSRPNLQQIPARRAPEFRRCIAAAPGNVLIGCDWNQVELRAAAWISGDPALTAIYEEGLDLHAEMAALIAGVPTSAITKDQRQAAKAVSFGSIYGIGPAALAQNAFADYGVEMTEQEARAALDRFFTRFAILDQWRHRNAKYCITQGFIRIGAGRVMQAAWEPGRKLTFPQCCNLPVQGAAADAMLRAITMVHARLRKQRIRGGLIATVHDELLLEVAEEDAEPARDILHTAMVEAFEITFPGAPTINLATTAIGRAWAELK